jgi:hypothetical protein
LLLKIVGLPNEMQPWRKCLQVLKTYGPTLDAGVLLYCFKIVLSTLAKQWMAAEDLS